MTTSWRSDGAVASAAKARRVDVALADGRDEPLFRRCVELGRQRVEIDQLTVDQQLVDADRVGLVEPDQP